MKKSRITIKSCESMDIRKHRFMPKMDTSTKAMKSMKDKERERERRNWNQRLRNGEYDDYEDDDFEEYDESINDDDDSGDGDSYSFTVTDIDWDTDGEDVSKLHLPETLVVDVPMECVDNGSAEVKDYISDYLSDTYGFCHNGFSVEGLDDEPMDESKKDKGWFGIKNAKFIYHGDWNDPEVQYDGVSLNYYDIEDILLDEYREEHPEDKNDKGFDNWMALPKTKSSIQSALDILVQSGAGKPIE